MEKICVNEQTWVSDFADLVTGFETTVPVTLKDTLGYPTHVSKQTFQTLGTIHSWPAVLACLLYVYNMAKVRTLTQIYFCLILVKKPSSICREVQINEKLLGGGYRSLSFLLLPCLNLRPLKGFLI